jgi:hypothetical protein
MKKQVIVVGAYFEKSFEITAPINKKKVVIRNIKVEYATEINSN